MGNEERIQCPSHAIVRGVGKEDEAAYSHFHKYSIMREAVVFLLLFATAVLRGDHGKLYFKICNISKS